MSRKKKRRGTRPDPNDRLPADPSVLEKIRNEADDYPVLSTRFLQKGWGFEELDDKMRESFLQKWCERSQISWKDLSQHPRHGLGSEFIRKDEIKPSIPKPFKDLDKFRAFRHLDNLPFVGWKDLGIFYVLWIERSYGDLYDH